MKKFKYAIAFLIAAGIISLAASGQDNISPPQSNKDKGHDYNIAIGARLTSGLTVKRFINPSSAIEGIVSFGYNTLLVTGLYEKHIDIPVAPGLRWFFGLGGHVGFFRYLGYYYWVYESGNRVFYVSSPGNTTVTVAGVDMILGLDYKFRNAPINVGLDAKPFIDFYHGAYEYFDWALSARFAF